MPHTFRFEQPCVACHKETHETCDNCGKSFCGHGACLFETGKMLTFPPDPRDEYPEESSRPEELCMTCYVEREGHPPFSLWAGTSRHSVLSFKLLEKGSIAPAADTHSWYRPPSSGKMLLLQWGDKTIEYDTYDVVQLLNILKAHEEAIRSQAKATSDVLIPESHKQTEATMRADAGCVDYSQFE